MGYSNQFYSALDIKPNSNKSIKSFSLKSGVPVARLKYYNERNILPSGLELDQTLEAAGITELMLRLEMGVLDRKTLNAIRASSNDIKKAAENTLAENPNVREKKKKLKPVFKTRHGRLYEADCLDFLATQKSDIFDLIFADPPFNLSKLYPSKIDDNLKEEKYLEWCEAWVNECIRVLKPGGAFLIWNLPKWNTRLSQILEGKLSFRHWISVDIKYGLPIKGRLYPSHYSLLYYVNGERPNVFTPDRLPMQVCRKCYHEIKDYGGYKDKMNPRGINLTDVWTDIPPVRHSKYKRRDGANELSLKLMDRVIEMASLPGDTVFDPFGGSGTTYVTAELKGRKWIGTDIGDTNIIVDRFARLKEEEQILMEHRKGINALFPQKIDEQRRKRNLWTTKPSGKANSGTPDMFG